MDGQTPDFSAMIGKLLENPDTLKNAFAMAENLKKSGLLDNFLKDENPVALLSDKGTEESQAHQNKEQGAYRQEKSAYTEEKSEKNAQPQKDGTGKGKESAQRRKQLLFALRSYMSQERKERIDTVLKILNLIEIAEQLGNSGIL